MRPGGWAWEEAERLGGRGGAARVATPPLSPISGDSLAWAVRGVEAGLGVEGSGGVMTLGRGLAVTKQSDWEVLDMGGPLGSELEELDVVPLDSVYRHCRENTHTHTHTLACVLYGWNG